METLKFLFILEVYRSVLNFAHSFLLIADPKVYFKLAWKNFNEHWLLFFFNLNFSENLTCPSGQLRTEFTCQWQVLDTTSFELHAALII